MATAAAGEPIDFEHDEVDWYAFHQSWVEQMAGAGAVHDAQRVILVDVSGESMLPTIRDGALCVVDRGPHGGGVTELGQLHPERLYLVHDPDGGGVTVKRVAVDRERAVLAPLGIIRRPASGSRQPVCRASGRAWPPRQACASPGSRSLDLAREGSYRAGSGSGLATHSRSERSGRPRPRR